MSHDPNPFEPWRPSDPPEEINPCEPWRPPHERPAQDPWSGQDLPEPGYRPPLFHSPARQRELRPDQTLVLLIWGGLAIVAIIAVVQLHALHVTGVAAATLALGLGLTLAISAGRRWRWRYRFLWLAVGVAAAFACWWFVPTARGLNLWTAQRRAAELEDVPVGDLRAHKAVKQERQELAEQFPQFKGRLDEVERSWGERTREEALAKLAAVPVGDLAAYRQDEKARRELRALFPAFKERLTQEEQRWTRKTAEQRIAAAQAVLQDDPARATLLLQQATTELSRLHHFAAVQPLLLGARKRVLLARLEGAWREVTAQLKKDRFKEMAAAAERPQAPDLAAEAGVVGAQAELLHYQNQCAFLVDLARRAGKLGPK